MWQFVFFQQVNRNVCTFDVFFKFDMHKKFQIPEAFFSILRYFVIILLKIKIKTFREDKLKCGI